jgi:hypothetical protein
MSSSFGSNGNKGGFALQNQFGSDLDAAEVGRAVLAGVIGGLLSAAGYLVYRRLPDEQRNKINDQARTIIQQRITELRENLNI